MGASQILALPYAEVLGSRPSEGTLRTDLANDYLRYTSVTDGSRPHVGSKKQARRLAAAGPENSIAAGRIALTCPHCSGKPAELGAVFSTIKSYVIWSRFGKIYTIGCCACIRRLAGQTARKNLLTGWWGFPWGLATPFVAVGNIIDGRRKPPGRINEVLAHSGIMSSEVLTGEDGLTAQQRRLMWAYAHIADRIICTETSNLLTAQAVGYLCELTDGHLTEAEALARISQSRQFNFSLKNDFPPKERELLLQLAGATATTIATRRTATRDTVRAIARELGYTNADADVLLKDDDEEEAPTPRASDSAIRAAYGTLGITEDSANSVLQAAYKALLRDWHPDRAAVNNINQDYAAERTKAITAAYEVIMSSRRL